jgi:leucyl/phenylalanyl-tRNA---protein transferase
LEHVTFAVTFRTDPFDMPVFRLTKEIAFPPPHLAEPSGLLAIGGDLGPERLIWAYQNGIFPWFEEDDLPFWYAPDPRFVLFPKELKVHKSMRSIFNQQKFEYTLDTHFETVMRHCAAAYREGQMGSWISDTFVEGYTRLHQLGLAHAVEVWQEGELVGGLYGIAIGKIFYGESMFSLVPNASKAGFIYFTQALEALNFKLVDCQQETPHLGSLGARPISRDLFMEYLMENQYERTLRGQWQFEPDGHISVLPTV